MEWQPIETAPKDGTEILASGLNYGESDKGRHYGLVRWDANVGWIESLHDLNGMGYLTHWMPLPEPPK